MTSSPVQAQRGTDERERLPTWSETSMKHDEGIELTPLERFIYDNEPAGRDSEAEFRKQLSDMLRADAEQLRARDEEIAWLRAKAAELMACFNAMKKCYEESDADCAALLVRIEELKNEMS